MEVYAALRRGCLYAKLPENCPLGGGVMEEGRLAARSKDGTAQMQWRITGLKGTILRNNDQNTTRTFYSKRMGFSFRGMRCLACKLAVFTFETEVDERGYCRQFIPLRA